MKKFKEFNINESIDIYQFGDIVPNDENYDEILKIRVPIEKSDIEYLEGHLDVYINPLHVKNAKMCLLIFSPDNLYKFNIYHLGDYVFSIIQVLKKDSYNIQYIKILDGIDEVVRILNDQFKTPIINESFDRYDFGIHDNDTYITSCDNTEIFDNTFVSEIENDFSDECHIFNYGSYMLICKDTNVHYLHLYYYGDYCFGIQYKDNDKSYEIIDGEENTIKKLKIIIEKWKEIPKQRW